MKLLPIQKQTILYFSCFFTGLRHAYTLVTLYITEFYNLQTLTDIKHAILTEISTICPRKLFTIVKIIYFNITRGEIVGSCQQLFGFICVILIIGGWFVGVTELGVGCNSTII